MGRVLEQLTAEARPLIEKRLEAVRKAVTEAPDLEEAMRALLELGARWTPDAMGALLGDALELATLEGREEAFRDGEDAASHAVEAVGLPFREQLDFLRQKRAKPTNSWKDAARGVHDRAFVVAGVTDLALLRDFQESLLTAFETGMSTDDWAKDFDRLVAKYGWEYRGEREWRIRTIFETNLRTSFMAGKLKQMRDPAMLWDRPYWQYRHGESRTPKVPRRTHLAWDGLVLRHDDPWWDVHFPPNDWLCSCGVRSLSERSLKRMGKDGPDTAPLSPLMPVIDKTTGQLVMQPQGVGIGWDYVPGDLWERGLVPSALLDEGESLVTAGRHAVSIDEPEPIEDLAAAARPSAAKPLAPDLPPEDYVRAFLEPFGAELGKAALFEDAAGVRVPVSELFFKDRAGQWKVGKRERAIYTPLLAEALRDPDEIWMGVAVKRDPVNSELEELVVDRRYIRIDGETGLMVVMEIGARWWEGVTAYVPTKKNGKPDLKLLARRRGGKLLWKRKRPG